MLYDKRVLAYMINDEINYNKEFPYCFACSLANLFEAKIRNIFNLIFGYNPHEYILGKIINAIVEFYNRFGIKIKDLHFYKDVRNCLVHLKINKLYSIFKLKDENKLVKKGKINRDLTMESFKETISNVKPIDNYSKREQDAFGVVMEISENPNIIFTLIRMFKEINSYIDGLAETLNSLLSVDGAKLVVNSIHYEISERSKIIVVSR